MKLKAACAKQGLVMGIQRAIVLSCVNGVNLFIKRIISVVLRSLLQYSFGVFGLCDLEFSQKALGTFNSD